MHLEKFKKYICCWLFLEFGGQESSVACTSQLGILNY